MAFEACSKERIQPFDDDEEDIWEEKEIKFATHAKSRNRFGLTAVREAYAIVDGSKCN